MFDALALDDHRKQWILWTCEDGSNELISL